VQSCVYLSLGILMSSQKSDRNLLADAAKEDASSVINIYTFLLIISMMVVFLLLTIPKIYLANQIYYESKEVQKLRIQAQALEEEQILLKRKIEHMKFENSVIYTMF